MASNSSRGPIVFFGAIAALVVVWIIGLLYWDGDDAMPPRPAVRAITAPPVPAEEVAHVPEPTLVRESVADFTLQAATVLTLDAAELPVGRSIVLGLKLTEPATRTQPLEARVLDGGSRELVLDAMVVGKARETADLEIEAGWLSPGSYLIHLRTSERSHFPLRRYPLEIRGDPPPTPGTD